MTEQTLGLGDYTSLLPILSNSRLQKQNPQAFQILQGLINNAQKSNKFLTQQFTDLNGQQVSLESGLQSALDDLSSINTTVNSILTSISSINATLAAIAVTLADRNNSFYGASAYNNTTQALTTAVTAVMALNADFFGSMRAGNTLVAPVAAEYLVTGSVAFAANATGGRKVNLSSSGGLSLDVGFVPGMATNNVVISFAALFSLGTNETVQANLTQDSGGNLNAQGALQMFRVSY